MTQVIELGGNSYVVDRLVQTYVTPLSQAYRTTGLQLRSDQPSVNRFPHRSFPLGIGWARMSRETGRGVGGLLDSTCWTALGPVTIAKKAETQTSTAPADGLVKMVNFKGNLWGLFEEAYSAAAVTETNSRKFGSTNDDWTGGGQINFGDTNTIGVRAFDMGAHKNSLFAAVTGGLSTVIAAEEVVYGICSSVDGAVWADAGLIGFPDNTATNRYVNTTITRANAWDDDRARLCSFGLTLLMAFWRDPNASDGDSLIEIISTTDSGANWVSDVTIPSGSGPKAFVDWLDLAGTRRPVLITAEGVYAIDTANNLFTLIYALDGHSSNGRFAEVGNDGALYIGISSGQVLRLAILDTNVLEVTVIGPPGDGFVSTGVITYIARTPSEWLMVNQGDKIYMIDTSVILTDPETGKRFMPWHYLGTAASSGETVVAMAYSTEDDGTARLHFAIAPITSPDGFTTDYHVELPLTNPAQSSAIKYETSSVLRLPVDDLGDPQKNSTFLQSLVDADDLGATATTSTEYITETYGLDGAADTTTTLGTYLSGDKDLSFGSGAGVAGKKIGRRLTFYRNTAGSPTTTKTPKLYETEIQGVNLLLGPKQWTFIVDVEETAKLVPPTLAANTPVQETIIANLLAVATATTMSTFTAGRMTQTRVRVPEGSPPVLNLEVKDADGTNGGYRTGFATMHVVEAI